MTTFKINETYKMASPCDQNCIWTYTVIARTKATITLTDGKKVQKCRINKQASEFRKAETVYPLGQYSMCPSLSADRIA